MLLALVYGTQLSPTVQIPAFVYDSVPTLNAAVAPNTTIPNEAEAAFVALLEAARLFSLEDPTSFFDTVLVPMIGTANSSVASQLAMLLLSNTAAANPFIIPTFDGFIALILAQQSLISRAGRKMLQYLSPLVWQAMHLGKLAFVVPPTASPSLLAETARLIRFMNTTSFLFLSNLLCPSAGASCVFPTEAAAFSEAVAQNTGIWAYIDVNALDGAAIPPIFDYTIRINSTLVPTTNRIVDRFPKGLGENYAKYIYSGFTTIELELNEYFSHLVYSASVQAGRTSGAVKMDYDLIDLFQSACNLVLNEPSFFPTTNDPLQQQVLTQVLQSITAPPTIFTVPVDGYSIVMPCFAELVTTGCGNASAAFNFSSFSCLRSMAASNSSLLGQSCHDAVNFVSDFGGVVLPTCNISADDFFTAPSIFGISPSCQTNVFSKSPSALTSPYGSLVTLTAQFSTPCSKDVATFCNSFTGPSGVFGCLYAAYLGHVGLSPLCAAVLLAVPLCVDEFATVCPFNPSTDMISSFPLVCLHMQQNVLSDTCRTSTLVTTFVEPVLSMAPVVYQEPIDEYVCRLARKVDLAFQRGVAAGAFPAKAYGQNQFYANSGALLSLVVVLAFLYPFVAHVRLIVQERERRQRLFLMLVGVHHSAILTSYTLIGLATMFWVSLFATTTFGYVLTTVPSGTVFSLFFTYGFSLIGLGSLIASFCDSTRNAGAIAPFVLFILSIPSFADVGELTPFSSLFSPCVTIVATDLLVSYQQSSASAGEFEADMQAASAVLFALALFYFLLALIVEQLRVLSTGIGFVGRASAAAQRWIFVSLRKVLRPFRRTRVYTRLNQEDYVVDDDQDGTSSLSGPGGISGGSSQPPPGYQNFDNGAVAAPANAASRSDYNIGGVRSDDTPTHEGGAVPASSALSGNGRPVTEPRQAGWRSYISLDSICVLLVSTSRRKAAVNNISGELYRHRVNCIVGDTCSGKTTLMNVLMGATSPTSGALEIDGAPVTEFNRQNMGVCFQHDVFWDCLTVQEHIELVQLVKGNLNLEAQRRELETLLQTLQLDEKRSSWATTLSSGTRRKLSVAMAFAGGSKLVFLDEPTSAVDPISKKCMWHLIAANLRDRCFVIATAQVEDVDDAHHMLVLNQGRLVASGSPSFIKRIGSNEGKLLSLCRGTSCHAQQIIDKVTTYSPHATLVNNVGQEMIFRIPTVDIASLPILIGELERSSWADDSLSTIQVSDNRLDEVYMRIARTSTHQDAQSPRSPRSSGFGDSSDRRAGQDASNLYQSLPSINNDEYSTDEEDGASTTASQRQSLAQRATNITPQTMSNNIGTEREVAARLTGVHLFLSQVDGIIRLRLLGAINDFGPSLLHFILPLFAILLAMELLSFTEAPAGNLVLQPSIFDYNEVLYHRNTHATSSVFNDSTFLNALTGQTVDGKTFFGRVDQSGLNSSAGLSLVLQAGIDAHSMHRFGALVFHDAFINVGVSLPPGPDNKSLTSNLVWRTDTVLHNTSSDHALPVFLSVLGVLRTQQMGNLTVTPIIRVSSHPVELNVPAYSVNRFVVQLISSLLLLVPFTFFPSQFVAYIVRQRETGVMQTQTASSLSPAAYWIGHFTWNMLTFFFFSVICVTMYASTSNSVLTSSSEVVYMCGVLILYGCCVTWISYALSKFFQRSATAQNSITLFHFTWGFALVAAVNAVELLPDNSFTADAKSTNHRWIRFFRLLPTFALGEAFIKLSQMDLFRFFNQATTVQAQVGPSIHLLWMFPLYAVLLVAYDTFGAIHIRRMLRDYVRAPLKDLVAALSRRLTKETRAVRPWEEGILLTAAEEDATIASERLAVPSLRGITASQVWKGYGNVYAAQNISMNVPPHECLVVIGVNGCGKSTMLRMIAGAETPSHGNVGLDGTKIFDSSASLLRGRSCSGYGGDIPGVDEHSTPYMLLHTMALFRGIRFTKQREQHILLLLKMLGLLHIRHVPCSALSIAAHRRVSVGMSLVGFPRVVILDEPSTGLDPVGRRQVWATLRAVPKETTVLLSSQNVEDVGMLATRFLLVDHGKMRLIGSIADVKEHLFNALQVTVRLPRANLSDEVGGIRVGGNVSKERLLQFMGSSFPSCSLVEEHSGCVFRFKIPLLVDNRSSDRKLDGTSGDVTVSMRHVYEVLTAQRDRWHRGEAPPGEWQAVDDEAAATRECLELDVSLSSMDMLLSDALGARSPAIVAAKAMLNSACTIELREDQA